MFTGRMLFLTPNQSTEGNTHCHNASIYNVTTAGHMQPIWLGSKLNLAKLDTTLFSGWPENLLPDCITINSTLYSTYSS